jgi:hypothetical protein
LNPFTPFTPQPLARRAPIPVDPHSAAVCVSGAVALDIPNPEATCGPFFVEAPDHFLYR